MDRGYLRVRFPYKEKEVICVSIGIPVSKTPFLNPLVVSDMDGTVTSQDRGSSGLSRR